MEGKGQRDPVTQDVWDRAKNQCRGFLQRGCLPGRPPFHPEDPSGLGLTNPPVQDPPPKSAQWKDKRAETTQRCRKARTLPKHPPSHPGASDPFSGGGETAAGAPRRLERAGPDQEGRTGPQSRAPEARARGTHPGRPGAQTAQGRAGPPRPSLGVPRPGQAASPGGRARLGEGERARRGHREEPGQASGRPGGRGPAPRGTGGAPETPRPGARQEGRWGGAPGGRARRPHLVGEVLGRAHQVVLAHGGGGRLGSLARSLAPSLARSLGARPVGARARCGLHRKYPAAGLAPRPRLQRLPRRPSLKGAAPRGPPRPRLKGAARGPPHPGPALPAAFRPRPPRARARP